MLTVAAEEGNYEVWDWLLTNTCMIIDQENHAGETSFIIAAREGKLQFLRQVMKHYGGKQKRYVLNDDRFNIDHRTRDDWTALFYATLNGHMSVVKFLLMEAGVNCGLLDK